MTRKSLLIIAHAPSGNTDRMAKAICEGARDAGAGKVVVRRQAALSTTAQDVLSADSIILFTPENLGYMSGGMKDFFDRVYYPVLEQKQGLPCAMVIRAGHDGTGTQKAMEGILGGLRWRQVQAPLICFGVWQDSFITSCEDLGKTVALGLAEGVF